MRRVLLLVSLGFAANASAGVNSWTVTGPEGGPAVAVAFHPDSGVVLALAGSSIYRSTDSAGTWTAVRGGVSLGLGRILVNPTDKSHVMVSSVNSMFRSDDGGNTFGAISAPGATSKLAMPADGSALYVSSGSSDTKVYRSTNFGATWQDVSTGLPTGDFIPDLVVDLQDPNTLYVLTDSHGLYKTTNAGQLWTLVNALSVLGPKKLALDPGAPGQMLLATVNSGLMKSSDGGVNWSPDASAPYAQYAWVGYAPASPGAQDGAAVAVPYYGAVIHRASRAQNWASGQQVKLATVYDVAFDPHSTDPVNSTLLVATDEGPLLSQNGGVTFAGRSHGIRGGRAQNLVAAHDTGGTMYAAFATGPIGIHRRTLSGWSPVDNEELRSRVPYAFQPTALAVDPNDPLAVLIASSGAFASSDGGQSWSTANPDLGGVIRSIQFASSNPQVAYAAADPYGVYRSDNHGVTWFLRSAGLPASIGVVAVDPTVAATAYAAAQAPATPPLVYKTTNGGTTWTPAGAGLAAEWIVSLAIDPTNPQVLYAGASGTGEGLFKTTNGGTSWARVGAPAGDDPALTIAVDPVVSSTLVMAINVLGGASRSIDSGATWEQLPALPVGAYLLTNLVLDPLKPSNIVGTAADDGLLELEVAPDLELSFATPPPAQLALGGTGAATVRVRNHGPFGASAVVLTVNPPPGTTVTVPTPPQGTCTLSGNTIRCALGALHAFDQVDVPVTLNAGSAPTQGVLAGSVKAHESDPAPNNDSASAPVETMRMADLRVALATSASTVDNHAPLTLTATATNSGPNASTASAVTIDLGSSLTYQTATPSQGSCSLSGQMLTCSLGALNPAASATVAVDVVTSAPGALMPSAHISDAGLIDLSAANDTSAVSVTSRPVADLGVQLVDATDPVTSGQSLQYTATVTNNGPDDLPSVTLNVSIAGATVTAASSVQGSCVASGATATCTLNALANGASATIAISTNAGGAGTATATATVASPGTDQTAANNTASQSTTVNAPPSGGGGGAAGLLELLALLGVVVSRGKWQHGASRQVSTKP